MVCPMSAELSTTGLGKVFGVTAKPFLFDYLISEGYLSYSNKRYELTAKGSDYGYLFRRGEDKWVLWYADKIGPVIQSLKQELLADSTMNSQLYHMTHIDNLSSILRDGLYSHNSVRSTFDISDRGVNRRREVPEPIHKRPIHDYVPLYFNVRNAMLYRVEQEYGDRIVILEFDKEICLLNNTLFTYNNAASTLAVFYYCIRKFSDDIDWNTVNSKYWGDDYHLKLSTMSECLVLGHLDQKFIKSIHCQTKNAANEVCSILDNMGYTGVNVYYESHLFFQS